MTSQLLIFETAEKRRLFVVALRQSGMSFKQIGEKLGVSAGRASQIHINGANEVERRIKAGRFRKFVLTHYAKPVVHVFPGWVPENWNQFGSQYSWGRYEKAGWNTALPEDIYAETERAYHVADPSKQVQVNSET